MSRPGRRPDPRHVGPPTPRNTARLPDGRYRDQGAFCRTNEENRMGPCGAAPAWVARDTATGRGLVYACAAHADWMRDWAGDEPAMYIERFTGVADDPDGAGRMVIVERRGEPF